MTTADFIEKTYNVSADHERRCSSVFTDYDGNVYSYGYHYPLAFNVAGVDFINDAGYSSTTAKHIAWAKRAVGYGNFTTVKLNREEAQAMSFSGYDDERKLDFIKRALYRELNELVTQLQSKKRKDTAIYADLQREHERVYNSVTQLEEL